MDDIQLAVDLTRSSFIIALKLALPLLLTGLVVGVLVSVLQAATQVQEQTLSFIPKIISVAIAAYVTMQWSVTTIVDYTKDLLEQMPTLFVQ
jgi:flagellar biosynthesis protein FliQ